MISQIGKKNVEKNREIGRITTAMYIEKLEKHGYCVLNLEEEGCEEFKNKAPGLYAKVYQQGKEDGRTQAGEAAEISAKVKTDAAKKLAEEKRPKTLKEKWDADPELRAEFGGNFDTCESYFMHNKEFKATGNVSLSNSKDDTLPPKPTSTKALKETWDNDAELRAEFNDDFAVYEAYEMNARSDNARIFQKKILT